MASFAAESRSRKDCNCCFVKSDMNSILTLAKDAAIGVLEDNAQGLFGRYRGRSLGTMGQLGAISFHETKNVISGEGGALLINDQRFVERAEIIREKLLIVGAIMHSICPMSFCCPATK